MAFDQTNEGVGGGFVASIGALEVWETGDDYVIVMDGEQNEIWASYKYYGPFNLRADGVVVGHFPGVGASERLASKIAELAGKKVDFDLTYEDGPLPEAFTALWRRSLRRLALL